MKKLLFLTTILFFISCSENENEINIISQQKDITVQIHPHRESATFITDGTEAEIFIGNDVDNGIVFGDIDFTVTWFFENQVVIEVENVAFAEREIEISTTNDKIEFTRNIQDPDVTYLFFDDENFEKFRSETVFLSFVIKIF